MKNAVTEIRVSRNQAVNILHELTKKGEFFSVLFVKKNGERRKMLAKRRVKKYLKGGELKYNPIEYNLMGAFDMHKKAYRMVNLETLISFKANGINVIVE